MTLAYAPRNSKTLQRSRSGVSHANTLIIIKNFQDICLICWSLAFPDLFLSDVELFAHSFSLPCTLLDT